MGFPESKSPHYEEPHVIDAIGFTVAEGFSVYCTAKILDLAQTQPPEWGGAAVGIGVLALFAGGIAANRWVFITRSRVNGLPRS